MSHLSSNKTKTIALVISWLRRDAFSACADFTSIVVHPICKTLGKNQVRILCYHRVCDLPQTDDCMANYNVPPDAFARQMEFLSRNGFNPISLDQFIDYVDQNRRLPPKTVILTFDDGYRDNHVNAFPILEKHGFKGTFFVVTDYTDSDNVFPWLELGAKSLAHLQTNEQCWLPLSRQEILEMSASGACFGSHTKSHCSLDELNESDVMQELEGSKECLEAILQKPVKSFCYPYGRINESVEALVKAAGYSAAVSTRTGGNTLKSDCLELRRILIEGQDSFDKFVRKVEGAYDWVGYLEAFIGFGKRIMFQRRVQR